MNGRFKYIIHQSVWCKTNTLSILMHHMRISTTQVSSVMLRSRKSWKSEREKKNVKTERAVRWKPDSATKSKDRAMPEGDNPSFWDEFTKFTFFFTVTIHNRILIYRVYKTEFRFEFCKFRCGSRRLPVESGRFFSIERSEIICDLCSLRKLGDEFHYLFSCDYLKQEIEV
jgi:hypothetical protein